MAQLDSILGGAKLATRTTRALAKIAGDAVGDLVGTSLPVTKESLATPDALNKLFRDSAPEGATPLPPITSASVPGVATTKKTFAQTQPTRNSKLNATHPLLYFWDRNTSESSAPSNRTGDPLLSWQRRQHMCSSGSLSSSVLETESVSSQ